MEEQKDARSPFPVLKMGRVQTYRYWTRPTYDRIRSWWRHVGPHVHRLGLRGWLCGKCLRDPSSTWDVDVVLTSRTPLLWFDICGEHGWLTCVRDLLTFGTQTGIDRFGLFVDFQFYFHRSRSDVRSFWVSAQEFVSSSSVTPAARLCAYEKIVYENKVVQRLADDRLVHPILPDLYLVVTKGISEKHRADIRKGILYDDPVSMSVYA